MHDKDVMHRDLKTENIMLSYVLVIKILELNKNW